MMESTVEYTVNEVAKLAGVTVKALHHYHKIGLLKPCKVTDAGYRLYGTKELERLQQILFYRELDFPLEQIGRALADEPGRVETLTEQHKLLLARRDRVDHLLQTLEESIALTKNGEEFMDASAMFQGLDKAGWEEALAEQNEYLKQEYGYDMLAAGEIDVAEMNEAAGHVVQFMNNLVDALRSGWKPNDARLQTLLAEHIAYLSSEYGAMDANGFVAQARFFIDDDFHRNMMESQQVGLSYYLYTAAAMYAEAA